jgi:uncharacterized membrane protein YgcG
MNIRHLVAAGFAALFYLVSIWATQADERILRYVSNIEVASDGVLTVTETIKVRAEWDQIKRGIFRDIPLTAEAANGRIYRVGFKLLSVLRDGEPEPHFERDSGDGVRIYIGREDQFVTKGVHTYTIEYETDRQIRFFNDHDEVYWNATGNEWAFPIDEALARVVLPSGVKASKWTAYTGYYGDKGQDYKARPEEGDREVIFETTRPLGTYEGLSVVVGMPKGAVPAPSQEEQFRYFLSDYSSELIGAAGLALVVFYYLFAWWIVGRDPARGVTFPRFKPPEGISPALAKYVSNRGFGDGGWVALSSACLSLAVKKVLRIEEQDDEVTLVMEDGGAVHDAKLPKGEAALVSYIRGRGTPLPLNKDNGGAIKALGSKFRSAIEKESRGVFFKSNKLFLVPGIALSIITIVALLVFGRLQPDQEGFVMVFLMMSIFASVVSVNIGKIVFRFASMQLRMALIFVLFGLAMTGAAYGAFQVTGGVDNIPILPIIAAVLVALNILFFFIIGAPTALGRQVLDEIEGLRMYLSVAEKERMNMSDVPDMSTGHFEEMLPYAVALGVEKPWANAFEGWLATAAGAAVAASYHPNWYSGRTFDARHVSDTLGSTASSMAGSFKSSLPVPKSSSSGFSSSSGGSSGGGGGGGGGGGW